MVQTPNMSLIQPVVGIDSGLTWENAANSNSSILDGHNHTPGYGVPITPSGFNINSPLSFQNQPAINLQSTVFNQQSSLSTLNALFVGTDGNLYFNDGSGNSIKVTYGGSVNATASGISSGTASASFVSGVLTVLSASLTPANISGGSILLGNNTSGTKYLTLSPPSAIAANYTLTLPSIPASTGFMQIDNSGNMSAVIPTTNGITRTNLAAVGQQVSGSSGSYSTTSTSYVIPTNLSVTITTTGRPVIIALIPDGSANDCGFVYATTGTGYITPCSVALYSNFTFLANFVPGGGFTAATSGTYFNFPASMVYYIDTPAAGTYSYFIQVKNASSYLGVYYMKLVAYEL